MKHLGQAVLLDLLAGRLDPSGAEGAYAHLAECATCSGRYVTLRAIRDRWDESWEQWASGADPAPVEVAPGGKGLQRVLSLVGWFDPRSASTAMGQFFVADSWAAHLSPLQTGAAAVDSEQEAARRRASEALIQGFPGDDPRSQSSDAIDRSRRHLELLSESQRGQAQFEIHLHGRRIGFLACDARRQSISFVLEVPEMAVHLRCIVQSPDDEIPLELRPVVGAPYLLAEIETVPSPFRIEIRWSGAELH